MKLKSVLFGVFIGAALTISTSALAESVSKIGKVITNEYAVVLNSSKLPVDAISIEGTSYLPVRVIGEELGLDVSFKNKTITLSTSDQESGEIATQPEQETPAAEETTPPVEGSVSETTFKGVKAIVKDGVTYFSPKDYGFKHSPIAWSYDRENNKLLLNEHESVTSNAVVKTFFEVEATNENLLIYNGATYINVKHYKDPTELK